MSLRASGRMVPPREFGLVLLLGFLWGSPYALTKISLETIPPVTLVAARVSLAAAALWLIEMPLRYKMQKERSLIGLLCLHDLSSYLAPYTLIAFGQQPL